MSIPVDALIAVIEAVVVESPEPGPVAVVSLLLSFELHANDTVKTAANAAVIA
jgi:hypothetical protein